MLIFNDGYVTIKLLWKHLAFLNRMCIHNNDGPAVR